MDYTKLPRHLLYKDRKDIDEFPIYSKFDYQTMEEVFLEALEQRPFIRDAYNASELILQIFNNARYITTLICMENHPHHYFHKYLEKAGSNDNDLTIANHAMPATMALVTNYLCHYMTEIYDGSKIVNQINNNFDNNAWRDLTRGGQDDFLRLIIGDRSKPLGWLTDSNFEPRNIREIVDEPIINAHDIFVNIDYIMTSLKNGVENVDDEVTILLFMHKKLDNLFLSDLNDNNLKTLALKKIDTRLKMLGPNNPYEIQNPLNERENGLHTDHDVFPETKENIRIYVMNTLGIDLEEIESTTHSKQTDDEIEKMKTTIADLEAENAKLKEKQTIEDCESEKEKLDYLDEWQEMSIRELAIFFSQALGVSFDPELVNKTQLANLAAKWTKPDEDSIRTKIGGLFKEEKKVNNNEIDGYSRKTKDEAINVFYFIMRIASHYSSITQQMKQMLDNLNDTYNLGLVEKIDEKKKDKQITFKDVFDIIDENRKSGKRKR